MAAVLRNNFQIGDYCFRLASPDDEAELRRILRETPMAGQISLSLEREPDYFLASSIEGECSQSMIAARKEDGAILGLAHRSVRRAYLNGKESPLGYLSQARVLPTHRATLSFIKAGYKMSSILHRDERTELYISTVVEDNRVARRLFERSWEGKPDYHQKARILTYSLPLFRLRPVPVLDGVVIERAAESDLGDIAACLRRNHSRYQFAPVFRAEDLRDEKITRGLSATDFLVARRDGEVVGTLALWDQSGFKQSVARGYDGLLGRALPSINGAAKLMKWPRLPEPGEPFSNIYFSMIAVDEDCRDIFKALLYTGLNQARDSGQLFATLGFAEGHPFAPLLKALIHIEYRSILYLVYWKDGTKPAEALDDRLPHVEIGVL
ncbi:hypothetical protein KAI87_10495 [Myxococcota bacterium]|nr:hypothetical protein [Myxococcota bacterium]